MIIIIKKLGTHPFFTTQIQLDKFRLYHYPIIIALI